LIKIIYQAVDFAPLFVAIKPYKILTLLTYAIDVDIDNLIVTVCASHRSRRLV
jgi:hypothetical protein